MKQNLKRVMAVVGVILLLSAVACNKLDVVGKESTETFKTVLEAVPGSATTDEKNGGWSLAAPDNTVRFIWSKDYSKSPLHDVMLEFDAKPFH